MSRPSRTESDALPIRRCNSTVSLPEHPEQPKTLTPPDSSLGCESYLRGFRRRSSIGSKAQVHLCDQTVQTGTLWGANRLDSTQSHRSIQSSSVQSDKPEAASHLGADRCLSCTRRPVRCDNRMYSPQAGPSQHVLKIIGVARARQAGECPGLHETTSFDALRIFAWRSSSSRGLRSG